MANQILAGAVFQAGQVIAGVDADNPPYVGPAAELVIPSESANIVTIVDSGTMEVTHTLTNPYPNGSNWGMRSNTNGRSLYVTGYSDGHPNYTKTTVIYDLDNLSAAPVVPTASGTLYSNIAFTDGKAFAIVSPDGSSSGRELAEIDPTTLEKISVIPNPAGIASTSGFLGGPLFAYSGKVYKGDTDYQGSQTGTSNGKVFVFDAADGSLLQEISSPSTSSNYPDINRFGSNVAVNDSWVAVTGYTTKGSNGTVLGSVHVYDANDLGGSPVELFSSSNQIMFGSDLAVSGDYVFVGSRSEDGNDGRVHVFDMSNGGSLVISLEVSDIFSDDTDMFGAFLAANETHLFVNAPNHRHQTTFEYVGAVHKFAISDLSGSYESILGETNQQFYVSGGLTNFGVADLPVSAPAVTPSASAGDMYYVIGESSDDTHGSNSGNVFIYDATDLNAAPVQLFHPSGTASASFGSRSASSTNKIAIGSSGDNSVRGSIFVYDKNNLSGDPVQVTAPGGRAYDFLGTYGVAISDTHLLAGSLGDDDVANNAGSAHIWDVNDLSASPIKLQPSNLIEQSKFGLNVFLSDDYAIVSARHNSTSGEASSGDLGVLYFYDLDDLSAAPIELVAPEGINDAVGPNFGGGQGGSISTFGNTLVVGADFKETEIDERSGKVYIYDMSDLSASPIELTEPVTAGWGGTYWSQFGRSVDITSSHIAVGAPRSEQGSATFNRDVGAVYVYDRSDLSAAPIKLVSGINDTSRPYFGDRLKLSDTTIIVGARDENVDVNQEGAVYIWSLSDLTGAPTKLTSPYPNAGDYFGSSVDIVTG